MNIDEEYRRYDRLLFLCVVAPIAIAATVASLLAFFRVGLLS